MKHLAATSFFISVLLTAAAPSYSKTLHVNPGDSISDMIKLSENGDTILINEGVYDQRFTIDKSVSVIGRGLPIIDGGGRGSVIKVTAPDTVIKGLKIRGSGVSLSVEDSGIDLAGR